MKIDTLTRSGLVALGVAAIAATALLGFAAGVAVSRDPEALRRRARLVVGAAAAGVERATLMAAQAREQLGDLWAEARDAAVTDVDEADFERAAAAAAKAPRAATTAGAASARGKKTARKQAPPARKTRARAAASAKAVTSASADQT